MPESLADTSQIGDFLLGLRDGKLSQEQAAVAVGVTARTLGTWERGEVAPPTDAFFALVRLYGADDALIDWISELRGARSAKRAKPRPTSRGAERDAAGG